MGIKHKVLKDFQLVTNDKKIVILKAKTVLENYKYITKNDSITLEKDVIDNNPDFFSPIDWKEELNTYIKQNKIPQPAILTKKLVPFIEEMFILNQNEPTVIEVEVPKIINTDLTHLEIELENKIRKVDLKESKIKEEQTILDSKELDLNQRESELNKKELELNSLNATLLNIQKELEDNERLLHERILEINQKEQYISEKSQNISNYIEKDRFIQLINDEVTSRNEKGYPGIPNELSNLLNKINSL
jgi:hypothetical protein